MPKKYRRGGVKEQHSIIPGIRRKLQKIATSPYVQAVTPGRICRAVGSQQPVVVFQYFQATGMKLVGKIPGAVQEVFVVTSSRKAALEHLVSAGLVLREESRPGKAYNRNRRSGPLAQEPATIIEASPHTIRKYIDANGEQREPMSVPLGSRLNGQRLRLKEELNRKVRQNNGRLPQAQDQNHPSGGKFPPKFDLNTASTMEEWLDAADAQSAAYWQEIKSTKDEE